MSVIDNDSKNDLETPDVPEAASHASPLADKVVDRKVTKSPKQQPTNFDARDGWVCTADMLPMPELEVLVIADGELNLGHLTNQTEQGFTWYSNSSEKCLQSVTHWTFHPELPPQFEINQRAEWAFGLRQVAGYLLTDAHLEMEKVEGFKEQIRQQNVTEAEVATQAA